MVQQMDVQSAELMGHQMAECLVQLLAQMTEYKMEHTMEDWKVALMAAQMVVRWDNQMGEKRAETMVGPSVV
eukprot:CAMPEP_0114445332 /NCGR_PEP_ID=MMETSP0103-20121206/18567_1 /TAXON_ID=37642 ORGANISM="Paraphysomonas imperforata, Strain PA2" /NCGR_SAMPLE_ID=MMETSP0103 /ASSEMBLY_ACC=CAM_ASM_000201 /LENGTH=71 /DNA_ID=CAMNT_0001616937 /DNA_START=2124 /DNA_END=2339 /DNA_ORIENTATION=-